MKNILSKRKVGLRRVRMAMRNVLTSWQQCVIRAIYFDGKSQADFAKECGISRSAVCRAQHRAEERLRRFFIERNT